MDQYFYVDAPSDHDDLKDCFGGEYIDNIKKWRFDISKKDMVLDFLNSTDSSEQSEEESLPEYLNRAAVITDSDEEHRFRRRRLHRARSFHASSSEDEEEAPNHEWYFSDSSIDSSDPDESPAPVTGGRMPNLPDLNFENKVAP